MKKLYKSTKDKKLDGICGGIGEFYDTDPTLIRVGYVFVTFVTGVFPGILAYIVLSIIIPKNPKVVK